MTTERTAERSSVARDARALLDKVAQDRRRVTESAAGGADLFVRMQARAVATAYQAGVRCDECQRKAKTIRFMSGRATAKCAEHCVAPGVRRREAQLARTMSEAR
jgi:hypothetical protein